MGWAVAHFSFSSSISSSRMPRARRSMPRCVRPARRASPCFPAHHITVRSTSQNNARAGFFEHEQYLAVLPHLPEAMRPVVTFAYVAGWRINSEVLPLPWRQVDLKAGEVRLDPGTTKNIEGRMFYLTAELKKLLTEQRKAANRVQRQTNMIVQHVLPRRNDESRRYRVPRWTRDIAKRLLPCLVPRQDQGGMPRQHPARFPAHDDPEHGSRGRSGTRRHETERPRDAQRVRSVQHRERRRPTRCRATVGGSSESRHASNAKESVISLHQRAGS